MYSFYILPNDLVLSYTISIFSQELNLFSSQFVFITFFLKKKYITVAEEILLFVRLMINFWYFNQSFRTTYASYSFQPQKIFITNWQSFYSDYLNPNYSDIDFLVSNTFNKVRMIQVTELKR